ncbi:hypothetical protein [Salinimonas iocasae]|uniref:Uncharacterized protein n=1 Tax=Salinimonas iocasae TaxID=2572577 RepID=A0A5B7YFS6_9ALTE|nr:hypothetical protein [Salinimonas iocasae]QCZ93269.1 hypothetical protein FBQ74_07120 [Salinimonas iocasae]
MKLRYIILSAATLSVLSGYFLFYQTTYTEKPASATLSVRVSSGAVEERTLLPEKHRDKPGSATTSAIVNCPTPSNPSEVEITQIEDDIQRIADTHESAQQADALILALHISAGERIKRMSTYLERKGEHPALLREAVRLCALSPAQPNCSMLTEASALANTDDAANWLSVAQFYAATDNDQKVVYALNELLDAPQFNSAYADYIRRALYLLSSGKSISEYQVVMYGTGTWAATAVPLSALKRWCKDRRQHSYHSDLCARVGQTLFSRAKETSLKIAGQQILRSTLQEPEQLKRISQIQHQTDALSNWPPARRLDFARSANLMAYDDTLITVWLDTLEYQGEEAATDMLIKEATLKSQNPFYTPCPRPGL